MNGAGYIYRPMHAHMLFTRIRRTRHTHTFIPEAEQTNPNNRIIYGRHPLSVGLLREPRGFVWIIQVQLS